MNVDTTSPITHVSLCAGYGGIDLGLKRAIPALRTIAVSEIEAFACANLVAKMEAGLLDPAPIWTDLKTFPWAEFRDRVDILSGGYPCQPFSAAGKRLGAEDPRHLWPFIAAGIAAMRPAVCFFENVEGHLTLGLRDVMQDLGRMGYRTTFCVASASECGAPHQRKRIFILAECSSQRGASGLSRSLAGHEGFAGIADDCGGEELGNAANIRSCGLSQNAGTIGKNKSGEECGMHELAGAGALPGYDAQPWPSRPGEQQFAWEPPRVVVDAASRTSEQPGPIQSEKWRGVAAAGETMGNANIGNDLPNSAERKLCEPQQGRPCGESVGTAGDAAMGNAEELRRTRLRQDNEADLDEQPVESANAGRRQTQPPLGRDADGPADWLDDAELYTTCDNRTDELRLLGNGVVPATAERAFRVLVGELMEAEQ